MDTSITARSDEYLEEYDSGFLKIRYPHWPFHSFSVNRTPEANEWRVWMLCCWFCCLSDTGITMTKVDPESRCTRRQGKNRTFIPLSYRRHFAVLKTMA